jgi:hypothetical protein
MLSARDTLNIKRVNDMGNWRSVLPFPCTTKLMWWTALLDHVISSEIILHAGTELWTHSERYHRYVTVTIQSVED